MARDRKDLGARKHARVDLYKQGLLIPAPCAPWIECLILDISEGGVCLDVGALSVPEVFGLSFTSGGEVFRLCALAWRRGALIGARFVGAKQLRSGAPAGEIAPRLPAAGFASPSRLFGDHVRAAAASENLDGRAKQNGRKPT